MTADVTSEIRESAESFDRPTCPDATGAGNASLTIPMSVPDAVASLLKEPRFLRLLRVFARERADGILERAARSQTEADFQASMGVGLLQAILEHTSQGASVTGLENLENAPACLYISNHRDIILDSALLNSTLIGKNKTIPHVLIGDNLLQATWLQPFYRLCKAVVVQRDIRGKELFEHSLRLSEFVRKTLAEGDPVWIAQRAGRTKDGLDRTEPALLRMLLLAYERNPTGTDQVLCVAPISVSYEYEPCDVFKAAVTIGTRTKNASADRARNDSANILRGLVQPKGRIQLSIRKPLFLDNSDAKGNNRADKLAELAAIVDREITLGYKVWPTNYAAHDLLLGKSTYAAHYTSVERDAFSEYISRRTGEILAAEEEARSALLSLYARPVLAEQAL